MASSPGRRGAEGPRRRISVPAVLGFLALAVIVVGLAGVGAVFPLGSPPHTLGLAQGPILVALALVLGALAPVTAVAGSRHPAPAAGRDLLYA